MRFKNDPKYFKVCLYIFLTAAALMVFQRLMAGFDDIWRSLMSTLRFVVSVLTPVIYAFVLVYILSPAVRVLEKVYAQILTSKKITPRQRQVTAIATVYVLILGGLGVALAFVIPDIVRNATELINSMPEYTRSMVDYYEKHIKVNPLLQSALGQEVLNNGLNFIKDRFADWSAVALKNSFRFIGNTVGGVTNAVLGFVLSFYFFIEKHFLARAIEKLINARFGKDRTKRIVNVTQEVDRVFGGYISAKILESLIVYAMTQIAFSILGVPYATLMSVIVAVFNIIPYLGPVLGALPAVLVGLSVSPLMTLGIGIALALIQAFDAYFLSPRLFGKAIGLRASWVLLSLVVGGGLFGLWGLLLSVPVVAVIRYFVIRYIRKKNLQVDEPPEPMGT